MPVRYCQVSPGSTIARLMAYLTQGLKRRLNHIFNQSSRQPQYRIQDPELIVIDARQSAATSMLSVTIRKPQLEIFTFSFLSLATASSLTTGACMTHQSLRVGVAICQNTYCTPTKTERRHPCCTSTCVHEAAVVLSS